MSRVCRVPGCPKLRPCPVEGHEPKPRRSPSSGRTSGYRFQRYIRPAILRRDRGICHICKLPGADQVDHLTPVSKGGTDDLSNLAAAHARCNNRRGNR